MDTHDFVIKQRDSGKRKVYKASPDPKHCPTHNQSGHRSQSYRKTGRYYVMIAAAKERRTRRAAKRHTDYLKCIENNPCLPDGVIWGDMDVSPLITS